MIGLGALKSVVRQLLPQRVYKSLYVLKNGHTPPPQVQIPGMITPEESAFYRETAARHMGREGAIVDLGCWLGATSIGLAQGVLSRASDVAPDEKVYAYDRFVWEDWMPAHLPAGVYEPGDSFLPEARGLAARHGGGLIEMRREDLTAYDWPGGPIKVLLVDAMKSEALTRRIATSFYPNLTPGGLVIHQDFKHFYTSWLHVLHHRLRQCFRFQASVPRSGTAAFEVLTPPPAALVERAMDLRDVSEEEIKETFDYSRSLVGDDGRANVAAAHVMWYAHHGRKDAALEVIGRYRDEGLATLGEFPAAVQFVDRMQ